MDSTGFGGRNLNKSATVVTNDPKNGKITLSITGPVEAFAQLNPRYVRISGPTGQPLEERVVVTPNPKYKFKLKGSRQVPANSQKFTHTVTKAPDGNYVVSVKNIQETAGTYFGSVVLDIDNPLRKSIRIDVHGNLYSPLMKNPKAATTHASPGAGK